MLHATKRAMSSTNICCEGTVFGEINIVALYSYMGFEKLLKKLQYGEYSTV